MTHSWSRPKECSPASTISWLLASRQPCRPNTCLRSGWRRLCGRLCVCARARTGSLRTLVETCAPALAAFVRSLGQFFMSAEATHCPTSRQALVVSIAITFAVGLHLFPPVVSIGLRRDEMVRTSVPKTPVNEDRNPSPGKYDVCSTPSSVQWRKINTKPKAPCMQSRSESQLRLSVLPLVGTHRTPGLSRAGPGTIRSVSLHGNRRRQSEILGPQQAYVHKPLQSVEGSLRLPAGRN